MSKKALLLFCFSTSVYAWGDEQPVCLDFGSSAFVGFGLGYGSGFLKSAGASTKPANISAQANGSTQVYDFVSGIPSAGATMTGFLFTPQLGWNCRLRNTRVVFGVIAGGALSTMKTGVAYPTVTAIVANDGTTTLQGGVNYAKVHDGGWFDVGFRFGVVTGPALIYIPVGWSIHSLTIHANLSNQDYSQSGWANCFWTGLGVDFNLTQNLVLGAEAEVHLSEKKQFSFDLGQGYRSSVKTRATVLALLCSIKYAFPAAQ